MNTSRKSHYRIIAFSIFILLISSTLPVQIPIISPVEAGKFGDIVPTPEELEMLERINENRTANGAQPLSLNSSLTWVARAHSQDMIDNDFFNHTSSAEGPFLGATFYERVNNYAEYERTYIAENIAVRSWGIDVDDVMAGWMTSQNHSKNILNPDFFEIGIGLLVGSWTDPDTGITYPNAGLHTADFGGVSGGGSTSVDLTVSGTDIEFEPVSPYEGQSVLINATIHNLGSTDAYLVYVDFYDGDPLSGGTQLGVSQQISHILVEGENYTVDVTWIDTLGKAGNHDIYVIVDYNDIISETNEGNNKAFKTLVIKPAPPPIHLYEGWNLVSFPYIVTDINLENVLSSIYEDYDKVLLYNSSDSLDYWKLYSTSKPSSLNDLYELDNKMGFWVHVTNPAGVDLIIGGEAPSSPQSINLKTGWNMVGYPSQTSYNRTDGLNNLNFGEHVDVIQYYDTVSGRIKNMEISDSFEPGKGYWIYAAQSCEWIVNN